MSTVAPSEHKFTLTSPEFALLRFTLTAVLPMP